MALGKLRPPGAHELRTGVKEPETAPHDEGGHGQINNNHDGGELDYLAREAAPKQRPEDKADHGQQNGNDQLAVPVDADSFAERARQKVAGLFRAAEVIERPLPLRIGIVNQMLGGVGDRQRARDDEIRGSEAQQYHDQQFAQPAGDQPFQQPDRSLAMRRAAGHVGIDRQRSQECQEHHDQRRQRRQVTGALKGNGRLVGQAAEVIDADQAENPRPRVLQQSRRRSFLVGHCGRRAYKGQTLPNYISVLDSAAL